MAFGAPSLLLPAGTADHWALDGVEEKQLTQRIRNVLDMLSKKKKSALEKALAKYVPPLALLGTAAIIVAPRVQETRRLMELQRRRGPLPPPSRDNATNGIGLDTPGRDTESSIVGRIDGSNGSDRGTVTDATYSAITSETSFT